MGIILLDLHFLKIKILIFTILESLFPLGKMPILEVDSQIIPQSFAINRYLAHEFGFYGNSNVERAKIDQIVETISEVFLDARLLIFREQDPVKKVSILAG